jgi:hypothetical protein
MSDNLIVHFCNVHELSKGNYGYGLPASIKLVTKTNNAVRDPQCVYCARY